ncbi:hypothetical protein EVAR_75273_1 [Eumeta japonica]|uniref:Uncharacterized protein n=1 Tax=Eumeta variegata TaxID=151549 RepID=A0A4C1V952_EUMVA|nr:hypothetical protein EVAR_75273_1 [Eumeta japonica]
MEGSSGPAPAPQPPGRRELSMDPVKAQGVLTELTRKERHAAELWPKHWGFYTRLKEIHEEQALKMGEA